MARIEFVVSGRLPESVRALIDARFDTVAVDAGAQPGSTVISGEMDRAAERALLTLLWDTGQTVTSMRSDDPERGTT